jgi:uncharacterized membrane protein YedE/YeeE
MIIDSSQITNALMGGILIGVSASLMLIVQGRIAGISGIFSGALNLDKENLWRIFFILGLVLGGFALSFFYPESLEITLNLSPNRIIFAGLLVGFGTRLGSGCTSGHGVCGISRFSLRSIVATLIFISAGVATVYIFGAA